LASSYYKRFIPDFGTQRGLGFNYTNADVTYRSGLENRIALLLGMNLPLSGFEENFYSIKHILLRPVEQDISTDDNGIYVRIKIKN
jgi:hypothetical protein